MARLRACIIIVAASCVRHGCIMCAHVASCAHSAGEPGPGAAAAPHGSAAYDIKLMQEVIKEQQHTRQLLEEQATENKQLMLKAISGIESITHRKKKTAAKAAKDTLRRKRGRDRKKEEAEKKAETERSSWRQSS